ncbi:50S ribosomal protein L23 [Candidatus Roizmanbacteria bacterium]|nr:50S ribosomal protein L23 [Candidatus Roizmanbacteria bacterium]
MRINQIIVRPLLTEKATQLSQKNTYAFHVAHHTNKHQISSLLEQLYKVKIKQVRITKRSGKVRRVGKTMKQKKLPDYKVAYVTLREGTFNIFPKA